jgi:hypothetical protein
MIKKNRLIADFLIFISVIVLPWWATVVFSFLAFFVFSNYFELIIFGFIFDVLYGFAGSKIIVFPPNFFVSSVILYIILTKVKEYTRLNA